jgi:alpha-glucosidase
MPYIYAMFFEAHQQGTPVARSLALNYGFDEKIYSGHYQNQYLFGSSFLVIPTESKQEFARVYLPEGKWYNFYNDQLLEGKQELIIEVPKEILPLYIKAGSIIPMQSDVPSLKNKPEKTLTLHVFGAANGSFEYYEDDGETFNYEQKQYFKRNIALNFVERKLTFGTAEGNYFSHFTSVRIFFHGMNEVDHVWLNKKLVPLTKESVKYIEPISDYDPYHKPSKPPMLIEGLPCVEVPHSPQEFVLTWK